MRKHVHVPPLHQRTGLPSGGQQRGEAPPSGRHEAAQGGSLGSVLSVNLEVMNPPVMWFSVSIPAFLEGSFN